MSETTDVRAWLDEAQERNDTAYPEPCDHLGTRACLECRRNRIEAWFDEYADGALSALRAVLDLCDRPDPTYDSNYARDIALIAVRKLRRVMEEALNPVETK